MTGIVERYREWLPVDGDTPVISLEEGDTPLIEAPSLGAIAGERRRVFLKYEGLNPTGSFKDRGMTVAVTNAVAAGSPGVICASTGNTSASAAAYAARAGLPAWVVLPAGQVAAGKLAQAVAHGARVLPVDGNFDVALALVRELAEELGLTLVNSLNPDRLEGQKTVALEIIDTLGEAPDAHYMPVGNAGNITATWRGYREAANRRGANGLPAMLGFQAAGAAPIVHGHRVEAPSTIATAIRIGDPASWTGAVDAARESGGAIECVTDARILAAYAHVARHEGVFCEPASAAAVAGLLEHARTGRIATPPGGTIVCTLTGHGLKDPERATALAELPAPVPARLEVLREAMES